MKALLKNRLVAFLSLAFIISSCTGGGEEKESAEFKLNYDKYTLDNGLEVVVHKDVSDPKVAVAVLYHVGSNREKPGKTGFAHFFEPCFFRTLKT
ncbi:hypothetical protein [uncultured Roseivirga sp.]|uniref:hypothetical protein n=1 Tax=uncultured Roseivirga sp. TaxID=543088 RepID=UPI0030DA43C2|tara:strand:- start:177549 stop:177833 length:285 start_codon:yes stop_codon:yes gene_type:complete